MYADLPWILQSVGGKLYHSKAPTTSRLYTLQVINFFAGSLAGGLTATFVCPLDVLKTRLQVQGRATTSDPRYRGISGKLLYHK